MANFPGEVGALGATKTVPDDNDLFASTRHKEIDIRPEINHAIIEQFRGVEPTIHRQNRWHTIFRQALGDRRHVLAAETASSHAWIVPIGPAVNEHSA
jgi:hypothetical protein